MARSRALATVIGEPEMLTSTVAPASAASADGGMGTQKSSHTSTWMTQAVQVARPEQQVGSERHAGPGDGDLASDVVSGRDLAPLVELAVGRQVGLGRHAEDPPPVQDHGAVGPGPSALSGAPTTSTGSRSRLASTTGRQRRFDRVEQGVLQEQVLHRVAGQAQLREHREPDSLVAALASERKGGVGVR